MGCVTTIFVIAEIGCDTVELQYSATLTGEPYLYFELKQVAKLTLAGFSPVEIRARIKDENLFQSQPQIKALRNY